MNYLVKRSKRLFSLLLLTIFLLLFTSCGVPSFLNLDHHLSWDKYVQDKDGITITRTLTLDAEGLGKIANLVTFGGPGIKLFYHLNEFTNYRPDSSFDVTTFFDTNVRGDKSLNGKIWYPQSTSAAPGFYMYSSVSEQKRLFSFIRPDSDDVSPSDPKALIGTFAFETLPGTKEFRHSNEMDLKLPVDGILTLDFTLENDKTITLNVDNHLYTYHKEAFERDTLGLTADALYLEPLAETENLYLHIFASLYGGKGNFSNTYWSKLQYLGYLKLE